MSCASCSEPVRCSARRNTARSYCRTSSSKATRLPRCASRINVVSSTRLRDWLTISPRREGVVLGPLLPTAMAVPKPPQCARRVAADTESAGMLSPEPVAGVARHARTNYSLTGGWTAQEAFCEQAIIRAGDQGITPECQSCSVAGAPRFFLRCAIPSGLEAARNLLLPRSRVFPNKDVISRSAQARHLNGRAGLFFAFWHRRLFVHHDFDRRVHVLVQADRDLELADVLQRFVELDLAAINAVALPFEGGRDVARGDGAKELVLLARFAREAEGDGLEQLGLGFSVSLVVGSAAERRLLHLLDDGAIRARGLDGQLTRQ